MPRKTRDEHLFGPGPKRILALDGGGVRGTLTLEYLARIEDILRLRAGSDDFRLADYFDLIGGTSTGSIIAAGLAMGFRVSQLQKLYRELAESVFDKPFWRQGIFVSKYPTGPIQKALKEQFRDVKLGGSELLTGLMIMTKRLDTGSPWPIHNNPRGRYFARRPGSTAVPNQDYLVRDVVRASTAAPHYFDPEEIEVAEGVKGAFVDGGVSTANNPSLQLMLLATLRGFGLEWAVGADDLLLVSVGTGSEEMSLPADKVMKQPAAEVAGRALAALMGDCEALVQTVMQWISRSATPWQIDREIGDLSADVLGGRELLTYLRYNVVLDAAWLREHVGLERGKGDVEALRAMDNASNVDALAELGREAAKRQVEERHFPARFDLARGEA